MNFLKDKSLVIAIITLINCFSAYSQDKNCYPYYKDSVLTDCEIDFPYRKSLTDDILIEYHNDVIFASFPNLLKVHNTPGKCLNVENGSIYKVRRDSSLLVIIPDPILGKRLVIFSNSDSSNTLEFEIRSIPQLRMDFFFINRVLDNIDSISLKQFKKGNEFYLKVGPKDTLNNCIVNYFINTYKIDEIKLSVIRKGKIISESKGTALSEIIQDVNNQIKRKDYLLFEIGLKIGARNTEYNGSKIVIYRIRIT